MIVNFKYHIASLVAVFMALGIGVIVGSSVLGESLVRNVVEEQDVLISRLEHDYNGLKTELNLSRQEIKRQKSVIEDYRRYAEDTMPQIIKDQLKEKKVVLMADSLNQSNCIDFLCRGLEIAGAELLFNLSVEEICASTYKTVGDSVDSVVVFGWEKQDQEKITKIMDSNIPVYTYLTEQKANLEEMIPGIISLILKMAQESYHENVCG